MSSSAKALFRWHGLDTLLVPVVNHIASDGECNWMEGVQLLAVYLILGLAFYFLPATP